MFFRYTKISRFAFVMLLATFVHITEIQAQKNSFLRSNWVLGISPGVASYYGDLSQNDYNPVNKVLHESGPAIGFIAGKKLKSILEFGLVVNFGKTSAKRTDADMQFRNKFSEYGIYTALSVADIVNPRRKSRFDYGLTANYSITQWRSVNYRISDQSLRDSNGLDVDGNNLGNGESTNHFGAGYFVSYALNSKFDIRLNQSFQFLNTDQFDSFVGYTDINDRMLLSGIGLIFTINPVKSSKSDYEDCPTF